MENITADDPDVEMRVQEHLERCQFALTQQESLCDGEDNSCLQTNSSEGRLYHRINNTTYRRCTALIVKKAAILLI